MVPKPYEARCVDDCMAPSSFQAGCVDDRMVPNSYETRCGQSTCGTANQPNSMSPCSSQRVREVLCHGPCTAGRDLSFIHGCGTTLAHERMVRPLFLSRQDTEGRLFFRAPAAHDWQNSERRADAWRALAVWALDYKLWGVVLTGLLRVLLPDPWMWWEMPSSLVVSGGVEGRGSASCWA